MQNLLNSGRFQRLIAVSVFVLALALPAWAGKTAAQKRWHQIGKKAHAHLHQRTPKAKNAYCSNACRKAGARKAADLGACKEGCVFG